MLHDFEYNGKKLSELGAVITEKPHYSVSMRDLSLTTIPGKNSDVITDNDRYKNVSLSYKISSVPMFTSLSEQQFVYALNEWLLSEHTYKNLKDTYNTGYFRRAVVTAVSNPTVEIYGVVTATITFTCDPFLYSDAGAEKLTYSTTSGKITADLYNPEQWSSSPVIRIIGNGDYNVTVSNQTSFSIKNVVDEITIDKVNEDVYDKNEKSCNDKISCLKLPEFLPGNSSVTVTSTSNSTFTVEIIPNWRRF